MTEHSQNLVNLSVVIPTYNGRKLLAAHLPATLEQLKDGDELIIVDDASSDDTVKWLVEKFELKLDGYFKWSRLWRGEYRRAKQVIYIVLCAAERNLRFGQASNLGFERAKHNWVVLFNSDVEPKSGCLDALRTEASKPLQDLSLFGIGCLEHEPSKSGEVLGGKNKLWFERGRFWHSRADEFTSGQTAWVSGGSGLFNRRVFLELGGFDLGYYPAYWEDVDISASAREHGFSVLFSADAQVLHAHETTNTTVFGQQKISDMSWRHGSVFAWRHASVWQRLLFLAWAPYWWVKRARQAGSAKKS